MINTVGDKEGGKNINRIVEMSQKNNDTEENRSSNKQIAEKFVIPKHQRH